VSNLERAPQPITIESGAATAPGAPSTPGIVRAVDILEARKAAIGDGTEVRRLLPQKALRTIGAWCFLDHYGPDDVSRGTGMQVPPHPHMGLQTATWLFEGHVLHRDSLGSQQLIRPGQLNLMTSGRGIAHSEESPRGRPATLHGLQLWIALPDADRFTEPSFAHHAVLPVVREANANATVVVGEYRGEESPAQVGTPLAGFEVVVRAGADFTLRARPDFEYGVVAVDGPATVAGADVEPGLLAHVPAGVTGIQLVPAEDGRDPARFFVIGGEPFTERLLMWWNFVARTAEEITQARDDWAAGQFAPVRGYAGDPLPAPALPAGRLRPR
jgi:redox-sensitive bicupin YhaK (pirin superfamily)